ncbi:hypothetical protein KSP40_PGU011880 [Platanthera guangdongensis]|uniref:Uncharacterized protein n=1 Tax=Platanthera guangdongensis TaxID=2320717 RepID=A0ABR2LHP9_9ASPA
MAVKKCRWGWILCVLGRRWAGGAWPGLECGGEGRPDSGYTESTNLGASSAAMLQGYIGYFNTGNQASCSRQEPVQPVNDPGQSSSLPPQLRPQYPLSSFLWTQFAWPEEVRTRQRSQLTRRSCWTPGSLSRATQAWI